MTFIISCILICMAITNANRLLQSSSCASMRCSTGGPCFDNPYTQSSRCCPSDTICSNQDYYSDKTSVLCADGNIYDNKCYAYCAFQDLNACEPTETQSLCQCNQDSDCKNGYQCRETPYGFGGCAVDITDSCHGFCVAKGGECGGVVGMNLCRRNEQCIITEQFPNGGGIGYCASLPRKCDRRVGCDCLSDESCYDTSKGLICCDPLFCEGGNGCGGITGETCKPGYECVSDPNSECDIGEPECAGVCIDPQRWLPTSTDYPSTTESHCGGFGHCAEYSNGCSDCFCGKNGAKDVCYKVRDCSLSKLESKPECIRCEVGYDLYKGECIRIPTPHFTTLPPGCASILCPIDTNCCDDGFGGATCCSITTPETTTTTTSTTTSTTTESQCCDPNEYPFLCWEGIQCCPDGTWSCSIGDGKTYPCNGEYLIFGEDEFGTPCTDVCPKGQCLDRNGECGNIIMCAFSNACESDACPSADSCEMDYCGGCNAVWKDIDGNILTLEECGMSTEERVVCDRNDECEYGYKCKADPECLAQSKNQGMVGGCWDDKVCIAQDGTCKVWDMECGSGYECVLTSDKNGFCVKYQY